MRSPKIKMTMTNAKIGDYPIAPRGRVPFEYHQFIMATLTDPTGPFFASLQSVLVRRVHTGLGLAVTQVSGVWLWAVGGALFETVSGEAVS